MSTFAQASEQQAAVDCTLLGPLVTMQLPEYPQVRVMACDYRSDGSFLDEYRRAGILFPQNLHSACSSRQAEYLAGRVLARALLAAEGSPQVQLHSGKHRAPLWPPGFVGSISHSEGRALCALARCEKVTSIGIDLEHVRSHTTTGSIKHLIVSRGESDYLETLGTCDALLTILAFSIKESIFKACYPRVLRYFDFLDVEIIRLCLRTQAFEARFMRRLSEWYPAGQKIAGGFSISSESVLSWAIEEASASA